MVNALIVIDPQKIYTDPDSDLFCPDAEGTINRINELIGHFDKSKSPILFVRHMHRRDGSDLGRMFDFSGEYDEDFNFKEGTVDVDYDDRLVRPNGSVELVKNRYSAFVGTNLDAILREKNVDRLVVCGFMTNFCCDSTIRDAHSRDYFVDFIVDATGTPGTDNYSEPEVRKIVAEFLGEGFARIYTTSDFLTGYNQG